MIVVAVFTTLFVKSELERMFRDSKDERAFHICNVIIILMASFVTNAVMILSVAQNEFNWMLQIVILLLMILPIYIFGHFAFERYKLRNRKYEIAENKKVIILNEKYLEKKRPAIFKQYNAPGKEKGLRAYKKKRLPHR